jgi:hypothetical protein
MYDKPDKEVDHEEMLTMATSGCQSRETFQEAIVTSLWH